MFNSITRFHCYSRKLTVTLKRRAFTTTLSTRQQEVTDAAAVNLQNSSTSSTNMAATLGANSSFKYPKSQKVFEKMTQLPLEEIQLLSELINEKLGIKITEADRRGFGGAMGIGQGQDEGADDVPEIVQKTAFDLKLTGFDDKSKIKIIKEVRAITGLGLKEAKELVEGVPKTLKKQIKMEEAEELKVKLEAVGAKVEID
jgi:large subunit ribosomal protein L7/L12